jgi:hypothetical protein
MKTRRFYSIGLLSIVLVSLVAADFTATAQMAGYNPKQSANQKSLNVSLIQLIATPEKYDGVAIRLIGYLRLEFEGNALYLHREDYERGLPNGIWIAVPRDLSKDQTQTVNNKYVICEGTRTCRKRNFEGDSQRDLLAATEEHPNHNPGARAM